jgi:hypothetical protein
VFNVKIMVNAIVEADNVEIAKKIINNDKFFMDIHGASTVDGCYSYMTTGDQSIEAIDEKK